MKDIQQPQGSPSRKDFAVYKFYTYSGPNYYLNRQAVVFNLYLESDGPKADFYKDQIIEKFPELEEDFPTKVADLFAKICSVANRMNLNLYNDHYSIERDQDDWVIAIEYLDDYITEEVIYFISDWFVAMNNNDTRFGFDEKFEDLQQQFNRTLFGGPTIYSLIEGGVKRNVPVHLLFEENEFQWGYGKHQRRGRSTIFHTDGIKDTEFTQYKDMCGDFLDMCGFPTPKGANCFSEDEIVEEALKIGFPVVIKPVAGHKGQGVTTGIESEDEVRKAFNNIVSAAEEEGVHFEGALVQQQIYGYDHRLLAIGGKFAAALKREPAFVIGDGQSTIKELIAMDNELEIRADTARSALCKIKLDDDMKDYLALQGLNPSSVPKENEKIVLRRVANISAGGVSFNVTNEMHPKNVEMVENIARFFHVTAMGIDVLAADISKPWTEGNFGIIEINAGPGVFMHLVPAFGGSVDIPAKIMNHFYGETGNGRIPIITSNDMSAEMIEKIRQKILELKPEYHFGSVQKEGLFFDNVFFNNNPDHDQNVKVLLRNPELDVALVCHNREHIHDYGTWHIGQDIAVLKNPNYAEEVLERDLLPGGILIKVEEIEEEEVGKKTLFTVTQDGNELQQQEINEGDNVDELLFAALEPHLENLLNKY